MIRTPGKTGISVWSGGGQLSDILAERNTIIEPNDGGFAQPGINVHGSNSIDGVHVGANLITHPSGNADPMTNGIAVGSGATYSRIRIRDNEISNPSSAAIQIDQTVTKISGNTPRYKADVRNFSPDTGVQMYHDPSVSGDSNTEGPAVYLDGGTWTSLVDGTTIT
jgi:hypothetical protein